MPAQFPLIFSVAAIVLVAIVAALVAGNSVQECRGHWAVAETPRARLMREMTITGAV